mgnify:CR=1 FL=1
MVDVTYELLKEVIEHKEYLKLILDRYNISNKDYEKIKDPESGEMIELSWEKFFSSQEYAQKIMKAIYNKDFKRLI